MYKYIGWFVFSGVLFMNGPQRELDKHFYGLYARVWENSGILYFSARSSEVKVSNFKKPLLGSAKVREVF